MDVAGLPGVGIPGDVADCQMALKRKAKLGEGAPFEGGGARRSESKTLKRVERQARMTQPIRIGGAREIEGTLRSTSGLETAPTARQERKNQMSRYLGFTQKLGSRR